MNEGRVALSRILAIHWYGFRQIIDLGGATIIAGGYGTGKSALLDLVQYVMLGGHQWRPNRSAAGRRKSRDLVSYCLCDTNTERDGKTHYVRASGVTIAALEFTWPGQGEPRRETWGVRVQFDSSTADPKLTWFFVPDRLNWIDIAPDGKSMLDDDAFRTLVRRDFDGAVFSRAVDYLEEMATPRHLHFDRPQMNKTMPKAIAFEPEENFEQFLREFLLESNPVDVKQVRQSLGAHREMQARLARLNDEVDFLRRIAEKHRAYAAAQREAALYAHAKIVLEREEAAEKLAEAEGRLAQEKEQHATDLADLEKATTDLQRVTTLLGEVRLQAGRDTGIAELDRIERQMKELNTKVTALREAQQSATKRLRERAGQWASWLRRGETLGLDGLKEALSVEDQHLVALKSGTDEPAMEALRALALRFSEIFQRIGELLLPVRDGLKSAERKLQDLGRDLESIVQQQTPGAFPLFAVLKQRLGGLRRAPEQLCRLVEVKPEEERWWTALELFLGRNRFAIIVDDGDYGSAFRLLRETPPGSEGEALVNPNEARSLDRPPKANSLAAKVEVANPTARAFVHHLLGDVICVETVEELDRTDAGQAITPDGFFKQVPTRRRMREEAERRFTLGREGLERMKRQRLAEQTQVRAQRDSLDQKLNEVNGWLDFAKRSGLGDATLPDRSAELPLLPDLVRQYDVAKQTAELLRTPERAERLAQLAELDRQKAKLDGAVALLTQARQSSLLRQQQLTDSENSARTVLASADSAMKLSRPVLPASIGETDLADFMRPLLAEKLPWRTRIESAQKRASDLALAATERRNERNGIRQALADFRDEKGARRHSQWLDHDAGEESNARWDTRLHSLVTHELEKHQQLAAEKKREWEDRLKDQVLDKLNERLKDAEGTVRQLRQYLDRDVGQYRYRVSQKRDSSMGSVWHLLDTGFEPTDELLRSVKTEELERAKEELMRAVEAAESPQPEQRALRLLDYRNYHRYDVVMEPVTGGAAISLSRSLSNMSGGENQAPFFICMLAAFHRVYDVGSRHHRQNLGIVVMDEPFSKLSGDGIEDCLDLARNFQLQLLMAVPIDRLGVMHPYADTTVLCRKFEHRGADGYLTRIDNVPTRLTPEQVREAIE
jgi:chromosome segregation ATPase